MTGLRHYQHQAVTNALSMWGQYRSVLLHMATGTGKTRTSSALVVKRKAAGRTLWLAHRRELIAQACGALNAAGLTTEVEQAEDRAHVVSLMPTDVVVGSVPTMRGRRLERWPRDAFATVVIDEGHHATAASYRAILDHFAGARVLLLSATPDRTDRVGLEHVCDEVAISYGTERAILDGYLVPVQAQSLPLDVDLNTVRDSAGDLSATDLSTVMLPVIDELAGVLGTKTEGRQTVVFAPKVDFARELTRVVGQAFGPDCVGLVHGKTPREERERTLAGFAAGDSRILINVGVLLEGWDCPTASCVVMARPTKSRALYAQAVGRVLRTLPGVVDGLPTAQGRRTAIAESAKPTALLLDVTGRRDAVDLVGPEDLLAGEPLPTSVKRAVRESMAEGGEPKSLDEIMADAAEHAEARAERLRREQMEERLLSVSRYVAEPLEVIGGGDVYVEAIAEAAQAIRDSRKRACGRCKGNGLRSGKGPAPCGVCKGKGRVKGAHNEPEPTEAEREWLKRRGVTLPKTALKRQATAAIEVLRARGLPSLKQSKALRRAGLPGDLPPQVAKRVLNRLAENGWRVPADKYEATLEWCAQHSPSERAKRLEAAE